MARLKVTDEDLDDLTQEELAGMKELQAEEEAAAAEPDEEGDDEGEGEGEGEKQPEKKAADEKVENPEAPEKKEEKKKDEKVEKEAEKEAENPEDGEEDEEDEEEGGEGEKQPETVAARPLPPYKISKEELARLDEIEKQIDAIAEKFDDGELTAKEMREQQKTLSKELDELKDKRTIAKMHGADQSTRWYGQTIPAFLAEHDEYKTSTLRFKLLDQTVKELQAATDDPTNPLILVEAHRKITEEFGGVAKKGNGKEKAGNGREIPPTLSGVPASDITDTRHKSEFAHLERLKGEAHEKAMAKLSPEARERYLREG